MIHKLGKKFTDMFQKNMPDAFVFALALTLITALAAYFWMDTSPIKVIESWYDGFWILLEFGMQMVLLVITGFCIALSPLVKIAIDRLATLIKTPRQVYFFVIFIGTLLALVSWGWVVITAVLARELALRIKGVNYPFLIACVYLSHIIWVNGLSSSIPLLLNTENNFIIEAGILDATIPSALTLGSSLNVIMLLIFVILAPIFMIILIPKEDKTKELSYMLGTEKEEKSSTIKEEAQQMILPFRAFSDRLNNSSILQYVVVAAGMVYIIYHFVTKGFDLNLNIMIFIFLMLGLALHMTPMRYVIAMKRASGNVSGILFQYPFYAGIMGIMTYTGLGEQLADSLASIATLDSFPFFAYLSGAMVNFAIPSAGGEFAVIGPTIIKAIQEIGAGLPPDEVTNLISRAALSVAYGESLTNLMQPFYLLLILPVMGTGIKIQARDIMGYLVIPFVVFFLIQATVVTWWPL
jgi:short-chain fatty acids transporter